MPETGDTQPQAQKPTAAALQAKLNQGLVLHRQGKLADAERCYGEVLQRQPKHFDALHLLGVIARQTRRTERGVELIKRAIGLNPKVAAAYGNLGNALMDLKRPAEALASYDKAIALKPDVAEAHYNRGNALRELKRPVEALVSYDKAIALKPDVAEAHSNRGNALMDLKRPAEALASYDRAIALKPDFAAAHNNRGNSLRNLKRLAEALASYETAIALKPDFEFLYGNLINTKMMICDWSNLETKIAQLVHKVDRAEKVSQPFPLLAATNSPELQRKAAEIYALARYPLNLALPKIAKRQRRNKIRIGYFSSEFRNHPTAFLTAELFEQHNRSQFEVAAFSLGIDTRDDMRRRLEAAFDKFLDVRNRSDRDVASLARNLEIDIAVDLGGFSTKDCRMGIFSMRAAPMQVNYLVYAGTTGAEYIDYLIADSTLIPASNQKYFSEKIVYLPNSYQANDRKRRIADKTFTRAEVGLPEDAFVFCCFNNNFKIAPEVFDCWMRILKRVDNGVIWLFEGNTKATSNLRKEAEIIGVHPERLIFAKPMPLSEHLARHRLADLFLDTLPYNAHTTASDALWTGLPVLTHIGETFAGRVAASLLNAIGLSELVATTPQAYEALAIELATHPENLAAIKSKLATNRLTTPLFDTQTFTRHIEAAYTMMYERYQADLPPDHIYVPR
jgi:predicted O-linked N-acetylglucosamine transferase (SPINDLY family)